VTVGVTAGVGSTIGLGVGVKVATGTESVVGVVEDTVSGEVVLTTGLDDVAIVVSVVEAVTEITIGEVVASGVLIIGALDDIGTGTGFTIT
jgi:hypothetical protein